MKSIMQKDKVCYLCGRNGAGDPLEKHHIFGGANRTNSENDGLFVWLCGSRCHRDGIYAVHRCKDTMRILRSEAQKEYEKTHSHEQFMTRYGKNYL